MKHTQYLIISLIVFLSNIAFSQDFTKISKKQIIGVGEYHSYTYNNEIKLELLNQIISKSKFDKITIYIEYSPTLEYWINLKDTNKLKMYFVNNTDRYFNNKMLYKNTSEYNFIKDLIQLSSDNDIEIKAIDGFYTLRHLFFTLKKIVNKYENISLFCFKNPIDSILQQKKNHQSDTIVFAKIKKQFEVDSIEIEKNLNEYDFFYLNKILKTPFFFKAYHKSRDRYMFENMKRDYAKNNQMIYLGGAGHLRNNIKGRLGEKLSTYFDNFFQTKTYCIGITLKDEYQSDKGKFDYVIINKKAEFFFRTKKKE